jgi:hypothetical protein
MYCPNCGKDNVETARFCRSCGRSLVGLLHQPQAETESAFEHIEHRIEELIAGHTARYFKSRSAPFIPPSSLKESWKLLGQGYLAAILDLFYTYVMLSFVLELRLVMLLFKSPIQWWRERKAKKAIQPTKTEPIRLSQPPVTEQLPVGSVTEQTTELLSDYTPPRERA